jgi:DNA replication protein DnaC
VVADGGAGTAVQCDCVKRRRGALYLAQAGIPERYQRCRLASFKTTGSPEVRQQLLKARRISEQYVESFFDPKENRFRESGLIFVGPPGIGKTHLAVAVLVELIERYQVRGRFADFTKLLHQIRSSFDADSPDTRQAILRPVIEAEVLVLDELGAQKPSEWVMETLYLIMNTRYTERRPTIFTTNYRLDGEGKKRGGGGGEAESLSSRIAPQLVSRLYEMAQTVYLTGLDYRRDVMVHQHRIGR